MTYEIAFERRALDEWNALDGSVRQQFKKKLQKLQDNPQAGQGLHGELAGYYKIKLRKSGYRLVYEILNEEIVIFVITVGKREDSAVYETAKNRK